ncbi:MAG: ABC-2 transporter permease [Atopobiaceae bacterium]|nr:ABC-2 transporter permease [Atopobiaceae bacterium]
MKALLYSDWCLMRNTIVRYLGVCMIIVIPIVGMANGDASAAHGVMVASMFTAMLLFYAMLGLFGSDEQGDWEQMRLALPVTPRLVVRERYVFLVLAGLAIVAAGTVVGMLTNVILSALASLAVPRGLAEVAGGALGAAIVALAYLALMMPYVFKVGMTKARITFSLPFILCLLLNVGPVRDVVMGLGGALEHLEATLGSPAPIFAAIVVATAALYVVSMRISESIYARRDF